jgi:hypothetical protein
MHAAARQVTADFPLTETVPDPVTLTLSVTVGDISAPEALDTISSPIGAAAATANRPSRTQHLRRTLV